MIFVYIYMYMYVCLCMHCTRLSTPYASPCRLPITSAPCALSFGTLAAVWNTTLRSRPFARYGRRCQFSWRQPGRRQRLKLCAYSYRTQEVPGRWQRLGHYVYSYQTWEAQLKPDCGTEERTIGSRTTSVYSFLYYFLTLYRYLSIYII